MPGGQHREIIVIEVVHRLRVVDHQLVVWNLVHPRGHHLTEELQASLTSNRLGNDANGLLGLDEAQWHGAKVGGAPDGMAHRPTPRYGCGGAAASRRAIRSSRRSSSRPFPTASSSPA